MWKFIDGKVPNLSLSPPVRSHIFDCQGRLCNIGVVPTGHPGTLRHHILRNRAAKRFNCLPKEVYDLSASVASFKRALD